MRLELIPIVLGVLAGLLGLALVADAWIPDRASISRERRRRVRTERNRRGEACVGVGTLCMAAALLGRDAWRFGNLAVLLGAVLLALGAFLNRRYLRELFAFRGAARRMEPGEPGPSPADPRPRAGVH